jgi:hypothetical protein
MSRFHTMLAIALVATCTGPALAQAPGGAPSAPPAATAPATSPDSAGQAAPATSPESAGQAAPATSPESAGQAAPATSPDSAGQAAPATSPDSAGQAAPATSPASAGQPLVPSPVDVSAHLDKRTAQLGETVVLTVDVTWPRSLDVTLPAADKLDFAPFEVRDAVSTPLPEANGRKGVRYTARLAAYQTGKLTVPGLSIEYRVDGKTATTKSAALPLEIQPAFTAGKNDPKDDIRDLKPMTEIPTPLWMYATAGAAGLAVVLLVGWGIRALVRRLGRKTPLPTTPHGIALLALDQLVAANLPAQGMLKQHYDRLAEILRNYLAQRFDLPVLEHTTAEVVAMMRARNFEEALRTDVRLVLDEADLVKFARLQVPLEKAFAQVHSVRTIVERTIPAPPTPGDGKPSSEAQPSLAEPAGARREA